MFQLLKRPGAEMVGLGIFWTSPTNLENNRKITKTFRTNRFPSAKATEYTA